MPKIPQIERRVVPSADKFSLMQTDTRVAQAQSQLGGQLQQAGQVLQQIQEKANEITDARQSNEKRLEIQKLTNAFKVKHKENQNPDTWESDYESYRKDIDNLIGSIDNKRIQEKLAFEANSTFEATSLTSRINDIDRERQRAEDIVNVSAQTFVDTYKISNDPAILANAKATFVNALNEVAEREGMSKEWVAQQIDAQEKKATKGKIEADTYKNPDAAISNLNDGLYAVSEDEKNKYLAFANQWKKSQESIEKQRKDRESVSTYTAVVNDVVKNPMAYTPSQIDDFGLAHNWSSEKISKIKNVILNDKNVSYDTNYKVAELINEKKKIFRVKHDKPSKVRAFQGGAADEWFVKAIDMFNDGYITREKFNTLTGNVMNHFDNDKFIEDENTILREAKSVALKSSPIGWVNPAMSLFDKYMRAYESTGEIPRDIIEKDMEAIDKQQVAFEESKKQIETKPVQYSFIRDEKGNMVSR